MIRLLREILHCSVSKRAGPNSSLVSASSYGFRGHQGDFNVYVENAILAADNTSQPLNCNRFLCCPEDPGSPARQGMPSSIEICVRHLQAPAHAYNWFAMKSIFDNRIHRKGVQNFPRTISMESTPIQGECWSCGRSKPGKGSVLCPSCSAVQAPDPKITYFGLFDQDPKFDLDLEDLETKYKSLMKKLHPDLTHGKSEQEKKNYAHWSALVTTAYTELLKPVSRATYLLKLQAIHVEEEGTVTDPDLIMEVMEIKEILQTKPERAVLEQLNKQATSRMDEWSQAFKTALGDGNDRGAINALQRMSYFGRVCDDIRRELL